AVFATLSMLMFKQFGVGLAAAILIDATIVRGVLLPASMKLLGDWNWYLPSWLQWLPRHRSFETEALPQAEQAPVPAEARWSLLGPCAGPWSDRERSLPHHRFSRHRSLIAELEDLVVSQVARPGFDQADLPAGVLRQPRRHHGTGGAAADNGLIELVKSHHRSSDGLRIKATVLTRGGPPPPAKKGGGRGGHP